MSAPNRAVHPQAVISRRGVLTGAAAAGAVGSLPLQLIDAPPAEAAYLPRVRHYTATKLPSTQALHMANRFTYGYTPGLRREMHRAGGPEAWFRHQLHPDKIDDRGTSRFTSWFPTLSRGPRQTWALHEKIPGYPYQLAADHGRWTLLRRMYSRRQVHEMMSEFWLNHLHVYSNSDFTWLWRHSYDALIRHHALGRFDQMLQAAIVHPTMLVYLDADISRVVREGGVVDDSLINENLGRELLELHTVGRTAGYTEAMVRDSAYILTGWTVDRLNTWARSYQPSYHYTGPVKVLGFSSDNLDGDGRAVLRDYLHYLAHHPDTAQRIARKLAVRFVSDAPSQRLVDHLASVFHHSGTDIKATLRALVRDPEFKGASGTKVRTPTDDLCATVRALRATMVKPTSDASAAKAIFHLSSNIGQTPFGWGPPDGFPQTAQAWSTPGRLMGSFQAHNAMAGHFYPSKGIRYRPHGSWLPQRRIRFDLLVDHLCRTFHGQGATRRILGAACVCLDVTPATIVTKDSFIVRYRMPHLIGLLFDTPEFMTR
jgi:hypothetical protein